MFPNQAAQASYVLDMARTHGLQYKESDGNTCHPVRPYYYTLLVRNRSKPQAGEYTACFISDGAGQVWWVDARMLVIGQLVSAKATTPETLQDLNSWWKTMILRGMV
jgi:serine/threonine-protein kinase